MNDDAKFQVTIPWGSFGPDGAWYPNHLLKMTPDEQYAQNVKNGYINESAYKNRQSNRTTGFVTVSITDGSRGTE